MYQTDRVKPEPQVTCKAPLPVPEAVPETAAMEHRLTVPQTMRLLVDDNETLTQVIVTFSVRLHLKNDAGRRQLDKAIVIRPIHEQVLIIPLAQPAGNRC